MPQPLPSPGGKDEPGFPIGSAQLKQLGVHGALALGARCLLRSTPYASTRLGVKNREAVILLAHVLNVIAGCTVNVAIEDTPPVRKNKRQISNLARTIAAGASSSKLAEVPEMAQALKSGQLLLDACTASIAGQPQVFQQVEQAIGLALGVLKSGPPKTGALGLAAAVRDIELLQPPPPKSWKSGQQPIVETLCSHLWAESAKEPKQWLFLLKGLELDWDKYSFRVTHAKGRDPKWEPTLLRLDQEANKDAWLRRAVNKAVREMAEGTALQDVEALYQTFIPRREAPVPASPAIGGWVAESSPAPDVNAPAEPPVAAADPWALDEPPPYFPSVEQATQEERRSPAPEASEQAMPAAPEADWEQAASEEAAQAEVEHEAEKVRCEEAQRAGEASQASEQAASEAETGRNLEDVSATRPTNHYFNSGFAQMSAHPYAVLAKETPLQPGGKFLFWLTIGELDPDSIAHAPTEVPTKGLRPGAKLQVVLFAFPGELELYETESAGEMALQADGTIAVARQAFTFPNPKEPGAMKGRLCFPVRCPDQEGKFRLRCSIYYQQILLQSHLVTAVVSHDRTTRPDCLVSQADYTIHRSLSLKGLKEMTPHKLSLMLNGGTDPAISHQLRFVGEKEFTSSADLGAMSLETVTLTARQAMRKVCWGSDQEYDEQQPAMVYKYQNGNGSFETDLITLARAGYRLYTDLVGPLAGGESRREELETIMRKPGLVQIACRRSPKELLPAALIYDHPLDTEVPTRVCPEFLNAVAKKLPLTSCRCFHGDCPSHGTLDVACPSGFWGFRHELGFPVTLEEQDDAATNLGCDGAPDLSVAVCLDPAFLMRVEHEQHLQTIYPKLGWAYSNTRPGTLTMLHDSKAHVVYFYCHGGMVGNFPYILVGSLTEPGITASNLTAYQIKWPAPGPLIFINGCKTTALQPSRAFDFVTAFISKGAAGVIGTEITIFEPLACAFAEAFFKAFFVADRSLGAAIRLARLSLLESRNPLGLVYVPFALAGLQLRNPQTKPIVGP